MLADMSKSSARNDPPWHTYRPNIDITLAILLDKNDIPHFDSYEDYPQIYVDGLKDDGRFACAFVTGSIEHA